VPSCSAPKHVGAATKVCPNPIERQKYPNQVARIKVPQDTSQPEKVASGSDLLATTCQMRLRLGEGGSLAAPSACPQISPGVLI
jgi:hypothetical protein